MPAFSYVYILQSDSSSDRYYVGLTDNLGDRLRKHNAGGVAYTAKFRPWSINTVIAFRNRQRAADFEKFLKTYSGRAFSSKRL